MALRAPNAIAVVLLAVTGASVAFLLAAIPDLKHRSWLLGRLLPRSIVAPGSSQPRDVMLLTVRCGIHSAVLVTAVLSLVPGIRANAVGILCVLGWFAELKFMRRTGGLGLDGGDQLSLMIYAVAGTLASGYPRLIDAGATLIGLQLLLSYVVAGTAKLASPQWRAGIAVWQILATDTYGGWRQKPVFSLIYAASPVVCWSTIIFEMFFPAFLLSPTSLASGLVVGACFHGAIAYFMGLYNFFFAFVFCYPTVFWLASTYLWARGS